VRPKAKVTIESLQEVV